MRLSDSILKKRFKIFNEKYFEGKLVEPKFVIMGSRWTAGMFNSDLIIKKDGKGKRYVSELRNIKIKLSKYLLKNNSHLETILLHEMIHYYGYYMNLDIEGSHGRFFKKMAKQINKDGYNIQRYYVE